jgi:hypothetical protein
MEWGYLADGVAEVQKATREVFRKGSPHVKIMAGGGVATVYDPLDGLQFTLEEIRAIVVEAEKVGSYAMAHIYTPEAITIALEAWVNLQRRIAWVHPDQAKARKAIGVPLNAEAILVLRRQVGKHPRFVFTHRGKPVRSVNTKAWKGALGRAGIADFRWHDLRHTWASWHVQVDTPLNALQELGGWESADMVRRYAHLAPVHLAEFAERLSRPRAVRGTKLAHESDGKEVEER